MDPGEPPAGGPAPSVPSDYATKIARRYDVADQGRPADRWLGDTVQWAWRTRIAVHLGVDLRMRLWQRAEDEAVAVFAANLRDLLLAAPAGTRPTMGLDPGFRTGVKVAVVDGTGKAVATDTIYPHELKRGGAGGAGSPRWAESLAALARLAAAHQVELIAIGNGTASRETDRLAADLIAAHPELKLTKVMVSEAGASVYSASAYATRELPGMDVSLRGAVSIARRLQDPLAELVKIDPKSIGVGQYQHDLAEMKLSRSLDTVVEDCVNGVGVDVNTASPPLLARVSGISEGLAAAVVARRDEVGRFRSRQALKDVPRLGPKAFEQCAGFLRIPGGDDPLDASSVHPEAYPVVRRILRAAGTGVPGLIGNTSLLRSLRPQDFTDDRFGLPTVTDILSELEKPGRDPRPAFTTASFAEGVETLEDLAPGMVLEGVVTNVAAFGAFVDIGVHQDGLVHVSAMSRTFVSDPRQVVKSGDVVRVRVLGVDIPRKRISLTLRLDDDAPGGRPGKGQPAGAGAVASGGGGGGGGQGRGPAPRDPAGPPGPGSGERAVGRDQGGRDRDRRGQGQDRRDQGGRGQGGRDQESRGQGGQGEGGRDQKHRDQGQGRRDQGAQGPGGRAQQRRGQGQGRRDQGGGDRGGRDQGQQAAGPADGAMADALRRAGLVSDQPGPGRDTGRRR
ncbi:MAG: Tex-like protein-like protein, partial [Actinomycetia bacterium]|nr:Tex-like protein-like protein [Actinomycetes bacterium]